MEDKPKLTEEQADEIWNELPIAVKNYMSNIRFQEIIIHTGYMEKSEK